MDRYFQHPGITKTPVAADGVDLAHPSRERLFGALSLRARAVQSGGGGDSRYGWIGFTLLELMIVITIILILATLGAGRYEQSVTRAKEAALKQDLFVMRQAIEQFTLDKEAAPNSLDDLVTAGYLRQIPTDPTTRRQDWNVETSDFLLDPQQTTTGITDVHSSSEASSSDGSAYSSW
jgi:general secretion pathway protein G